VSQHQSVERDLLYPAIRQHVANDEPMVDNLRNGEGRLEERLRNDEWDARSEHRERPQARSARMSHSRRRLLGSPLHEVFALGQGSTDVGIAGPVGARNFSSTFKKFPTFKVALSEGGIGWIPYLMDKVDCHYLHHRAWTGEDFGDKLPSQTLRERIVTCFIEDPTSVKLRHDIGIDTITWECDYPHSDSTWPTSPVTLWKEIGEIPDVDIDKITHLNAMRVYHFNPFSL
jgi:hypothetical protein